MNWTYQFGVDVDCVVGTACNSRPEFEIKYSDEVLDPLDERALVEADGICGTVAIDWNGNGNANETLQNFNLNGDGDMDRCGFDEFGELTGFDDFEAIDLNFRDNPLQLFNPDPDGIPPGLRCRTP